MPAVQDRFDELARALDQIREDAISRSRQRIHRRAAPRSARSHPAAPRAPATIPPRCVRVPTQTGNPSGCRIVSFGPARRWIAAAAAAGLAAGLFLGFAMDRRMHYAAMAAAVQQPVRTPAVAWQTAAELRDEQFLSRDRRCADGLAGNQSCARSTR